MTQLLNKDLTKEEEEYDSPTAQLTEVPVHLVKVRVEFGASGLDIDDRIDLEHRESRSGKIHEVAHSRIVDVLGLSVRLRSTSPGGSDDRVDRTTSSGLRRGGLPVVEVTLGERSALEAELPVLVRREALGVGIVNPAETRLSREVADTLDVLLLAAKTRGQPRVFPSHKFSGPTPPSEL